MRSKRMDVFSRPPDRKESLMWQKKTLGVLGGIFLGLALFTADMNFKVLATSYLMISLCLAVAYFDSEF